MINMKYGLLAVTAAAFIAAPAQAQTMMQDEYPVVLSGTVAEIGDDEFTLQYDGTNYITVEMDDWDMFWETEETELLTVGDEVVVTGQIDDDLFEGREIAANSVYLVTDSTFYTRDDQAAYPSYLYGSANNQDLASQLAMQEPAAGGKAAQTMTDTPKSWVSAVGTISSIEGSEVIVDAGEFDLTVNMGDLENSPQNLTSGDQIFVSGLMDQDFLSNQEISANRLVKISQHKTASQQKQDEENAPEMMYQNEQAPAETNFPG